jgi:hypothetical protein
VGGVRAQIKNSSGFSTRTRYIKAYILKFIECATALKLLPGSEILGVE